MKRVLLALLLIGAAALALFGAGSAGGRANENPTLLIALAALALASIAAILAYRSHRVTTTLRAELAALARSIDRALRDVAERSSKDVATISEMNEHVAREIERLATNLALQHDNAAAVAAPLPSGDNVVSMPAGKRLRAVAGDQPAADERGVVEAACRRAIASGIFEISLQPIVSVSKGVAAGFEAFASIPLDGREPVDIRRLADSLPGTVLGSGSAAFERILLTCALQSGRRRLGAAGQDMPVHVALSDALLADGAEVDLALDAVAAYPELAPTLVISLPEAALRAGHPSVSRITGLGIRVAAEGWHDEQSDAAMLTRTGATFLKLSASRLLDRAPNSRQSAPTAFIVEAAAAAGLVVIATGVSTDEDAVGLIDLGIDLMVGDRFSRPRRLKPDSDRPSRLALV